MNMDAITLEDCILNYEVNGKAAIIENGRITRFEDESPKSLNIVYHKTSE